ncbi:MAG: hypothetical protein QOJ50_3950 [Cryptosporangiaceae bacterium]|nr:hypothetical protein [Cryptosporangiaceae bacterium]
MNEAGFRKRVIQTATPLLAPGERILVAARSTVGSAGSQLAGAAAIAVGGALGGLLAKPKAQFIALTGQRLILLDRQFGGRPARTPAAVIPRSAITVTKVSFFVITRITLAVDGEPKGLSFSFPLIDRKDAKALIAELSTTAGQPQSA